MFPLSTTSTHLANHQHYGPLIDLPPLFEETSNDYICFSNYLDTQLNPRKQKSIQASEFSVNRLIITVVV